MNRQQRDQPIAQSDATVEAVTFVVFDAREGRITWADDEVIGYMCGCGGDEELTLSIYADMPTKCPECHARLYYRQRIEIIQVTNEQTTTRPTNSAERRQR